jgi:hypothetical protein
MKADTYRSLRTKLYEQLVLVRIPWREQMQGSQGVRLTNLSVFEFCTQENPQTPCGTCGIASFSERSFAQERDRDGEKLYIRINVQVCRFNYINYGAYYLKEPNQANQLSVAKGQSRKRQASSSIEANYLKLYEPLASEMMAMVSAARMQTNIK